jgi:hypothetical protein
LVFITPFREMLSENAPEPMKTTIEIDETYISGKEINRHASKKGKAKKRQGRSTDIKTAVLGVVELAVMYMLKRCSRRERICISDH